MIRKEIKILRFYGFLILLMVMILNDLILKSHYLSLITGKISDFSGLFIFPVLMSKM